MQHNHLCHAHNSQWCSGGGVRSRTEPLGTSDPHLLTVCHLEGIGYTILPGSDGTIWTPPPGT